MVYNLVWVRFRTSALLTFINSRVKVFNFYLIELVFNFMTFIAYTFKLKPFKIFFILNIHGKHFRSFRKLLSTWCDFFPSSVEFWCPFPILNYHRLAWETALKQEVWWLESFDRNQVLCGSICLVCIYLGRDRSAHCSGNPFVLQLCLWAIPGKKEEATRSASVLVSFGPHPKEDLLMQKSSYRIFGHLQ